MTRASIRRAPHDVVHFASAMWHIAVHAVPQLGSAQTVQRLPAAVRLDSPFFYPISTVLTLPNLFLAPIKVFEVVLESYFTFIELLVN